MTATLLLLHDRLAVTTTWFMLIIGIWAVLLWLLQRPLAASWFGAVVVAEIAIIIQALVGAWLYLGVGLGPALPRPFMHILYGIVAVIGLPSAWGYFGNLQDERVKALAMAFTCLFLWGILQRASSVALYPGPPV